MSSGHIVTPHPSAAHVTVRFGGETIAETRQSLRVEETGYSPVYYIPRKDVRMELLEPTERSTHCPFKGDASYFTIKAGGKEAQNAVWTYQSPKDSVGEIKGYLAFYADQLDAFEVEGV